jgi:hypothetical protein
MRAEGCVRGVNNASSTMSDVECFMYGVDFFINRLSLFSHVFFVVIEMKKEDTKKIEAFYLRWDENRDKNSG